MKIIKGNIVETEKGIICQQVNSQGKMELGLTKQIAQKYPKVKQEYVKFVTNNNKEDLLGSVNIVEISKSQLYVANVFSQYDYGYDKDTVYTDYVALENALLVLIGYWRNERANLHNLPIYLPYGIGCGCGNGDWQVVKQVIKKVEKKEKMEFNIVKWEC